MMEEFDTLDYKLFSWSIFTLNIDFWNKKLSQKQISWTLGFGEYYLENNNIRYGRCGLQRNPETRQIEIEFKGPTLHTRFGSKWGEKLQNGFLEDFSLTWFQFEIFGSELTSAQGFCITGYSTRNPFNRLSQSKRTNVAYFTT